MFVNLLQAHFFLLLFALLLAFYTLSLPAECAHDPIVDLCLSDKDVIFKNEEIKKALKQNGEDVDEKKINVKKVFIFASDQSMVALAETTIGKDTEDKKLFFVKKVLKETDGKWCKSTSESKTVKWNIKEDSTQTNTFSGKGTSAVVVKGSNLYIFVVNGTSLQGDSGSSGSTENINFPIFVSKVPLSGEKMFDESILFEKKDLILLSVASKDMEELKKELPITSLTDSYAFLTEGEEKKVVLVVNSETNKNSKRKNVAALYYMNEANNKLELMYITLSDSCILHFIPWDKKYFMIPTGCTDCSTYTVNESADMKIWTKSNGLFSSLLDTLCGGKAFITTHIEGNKVLLFLKENRQDSDNKLSLWITDGSRLHNVGVVDESFKCSFNGFLLQKGKELFLLYNNCKDQDSTDCNNFVLANLSEKINDIKNQLQKWKTSSETVSKLCGYKKDCHNKMPTDGLVSFLHNNIDSSKNEWKDEYDYASATVTDGEKNNDGGFTLKIPGAEIKWEVNKGITKSLYNFMKYGFTFVSTVIISKVPESDNNGFFFGLIINDNGEANNKRFGLFYEREKKWKLVKDTEEVVVENKKLESEGKYQLALCFTADGKLSAYVDWKPLGNSKEITIVEHESIKQNKDFHFAAKIDKETSTTASEFHVTVADFLLYNRPLNDEEIKQLKENFVTTENDQNTHSSGQAEIPLDSGLLSGSTISGTESGNNGDKETVNTITTTDEEPEVTSTSLSFRESTVSANCSFVVLYGLLSVWAFVFCLFNVL